MNTFLTVMPESMRKKLINVCYLLKILSEFKNYWSLSGCQILNSCDVQGRNKFKQRGFRGSKSIWASNSLVWLDATIIRRSKIILLFSQPLLIIITLFKESYFICAFYLLILFQVAGKNKIKIQFGEIFN